MANQIIEYVKQFPKPVIVMENLDGIRRNFKRSKSLNRRFHSLPFRKLQEILEYKALLNGIEVKYLRKKDVRNISRKCHSCGHFARITYEREFKCPRCGLIYNRDLNACINIAHRVMSSMGWRSCEPRGPAYVTKRKAPAERWNLLTLVVEPLTYVLALTPSSGSISKGYLMATAQLTSTWAYICFLLTEPPMVGRGIRSSVIEATFAYHSQANSQIRN